jgi:hypothetical protein
MPRTYQVLAILTLLVLAAGTAWAGCPVISKSGCPESGAEIYNNDDGTTCFMIFYGGINSRGNLCSGVCEEGSCRHDGRLPYLDSSRPGGRGPTSRAVGPLSLVRRR